MRIGFGVLIAGIVVAGAGSAAVASDRTGLCRDQTRGFQHR